MTNHQLVKNTITTRKTIIKTSNKESKGKNTPFSSLPERKSKMSKLIKGILDSEERPPKKSLFKFTISDEASKYNGKILESNNFDYEKILSKQKETNIYYGSEFRMINILDSLFKYHKDWERLKSFLSNGTDTSFHPLDAEKIKTDCEENINRGNHKSSFKSDEEVKFVQKQYNKEVSKGWMIPFPVKTLRKMKNACVIPIGVANQFSINENGETIKKLRLTHDCSWEGPSSFSVNNRINEELLPPLQYGRCLLRVLHNLQYMRFKNPTIKILMAKHDLDSAYRRLHWHARCALLCITVVSNIAYLLTRLCFGIASGPNEWCLVSETIVDFANVLMRDSTWNPNETFNPNEFIPSHIDYVEDSVPIETVKDIIYKNISTEDSLFFRSRFSYPKKER